MISDHPVAAPFNNKPSKPQQIIGAWLPFLLIPAMILLGWQVVIAPIAQRAPPALALRVDSASPAVLSRAAELEFQAQRYDQARELARESLVRAPFNLRALRVFGLVADREGRKAQADDILTLAGNWSLRDSPTHAWLINRRLQTGDYASSFAHADTLLRRKEASETVFSLLAAAMIDPNAVRPLRDVLATNPPWRRNFFQYLQLKDGTELALAKLVAGLEPTPGRFTDAELSSVYRQWANTGRIGALKGLRTALNRPPLLPAVVNGSFTSEPAVLPFDMRILASPGLSVERTDDELRSGNSALEIAYDGFGAGAATEQLLLLPPGRYRFTSQFRVKDGGPDARLSWQVHCVENNRPILVDDLTAPDNEAVNAWHDLGTDFVISMGSCTAQWLRLVTQPGDRRAPVVVRVDNVSIVRRE